MFKLPHPFNLNVTNLIFDNNDNKNACVQIGLNRLFWTQAYFEHMENQIKAVIYARVSSIGDRQSTDRQVNDLTDYAAYKGYEVLGVYTEHISGAKKNGERPVLREAIERCKVEAQNQIPDSGLQSCVILLVSELSRLGRNAFEVLETVKELADSGINLHMQKEQMTLLGEDGKPSTFAPIMLATLSTCAQLERDNISFRLNSGRKQYVEKGGKLGRPAGSIKWQDKKREEYREVINLLNKGYAIRDIAKLTGKGISTVQRVKKEFVAWHLFVKPGWCLKRRYDAKLPRYVT